MIEAALDGRGNLYLADFFGNLVGELQLSQPSALNFATTALGYISSDSPQSVESKTRATQR
jgi:hypothetical protein